MNNLPQLPILGDDLIEISVEITTVHKKKIDQLKSHIDLSNTSIQHFGIVSQNQLGTFSEIVLKQIRSEEALGIDTTLTMLVSELERFDKSINRWSFFSILESTESKISRINNEYQNTAKIILSIERELEKQHKKLSVDQKILEKMFDENKSHFENISLYIYAGELKIKEIHEDILPRLKTDVLNLSNKELNVDPDQLEAQISRFENRLQDLKLSKIVSIQLATQIRLMQSNNAILIDKLQSCIINTLPLWKNQTVLSLNIAKSQQTLQTHGSLTKIINKLLIRNSKDLHKTTSQASKQKEEKVIELSTFKNINQNLLSSVNDALSAQQKTTESIKFITR